MSIATVRQVVTQARVPAACPPGFSGRYTAQAGDTMFLIAQRYGITLTALAAANPHITNPNVLFPGDVLCVPASAAPRVPASCPVGFQSRYTVQPGDTMFFIAQTFGVSLNALIAANPHITNPNVIFPGDVLCVPGANTVPVPCAALLLPPVVGSAAAGAVLPRVVPTGQRAVSVLAAGLPDPAAFGDFDSYEALVTLPPPESGAFGFLLQPTGALPSQPVTWAGTIEFPLPGGFTPFTTGVTVTVRPASRDTGSTGPVVLQGSLANCCR